MFVAVLDDSRKDIEIIRQYLNKCSDVEADYYTDSKSLFNIGKLYDAFFLDVNMPDESGIEVAEKIRKQDFSVPIVFISWHQEYEHNSFKVHPFCFIRKEHIEGEMHDCIQDLIKWYQFENTLFYIDDTKAIKLNHIYYFEKIQNKIEIHLESNEVICTYKTLTQINEMMLPNFHYVNKSVILNFRKIKRLGDKHTVLLMNHESIYVSRARWKRVKEDYLLSVLDRLK